MNQIFNPADLFNSVCENKIIKIKRISSAYTNKVYKIETAEGNFLLKIYSEPQIHNYSFNNINLIFKNEFFKIEEYLEHLNFDFHEHSSLVSKSLAELHSKKWDALSGRIYETFFKKIELKFPKQVDFLNLIKRILKRIDSKVKIDVSCVCHNDLQPGNILIIQNEANFVANFIDFETVSINNPLSDIANYFLEASMDYTDCIIKEEIGLTLGEKEKFLKEYILHSKILAGFQVSDILAEIKICENYSHLLWFVWSILFENINTDFNHSMYRKDRAHKLFLNGIINESEKADLIEKCK